MAEKETRFLLTASLNALHHRIVTQPITKRQYLIKRVAA